MYWAWVAAFLLKLVGATADVSWHFQHLRETLAIPHVINSIGFFLATGLLAYQLIYRKYTDVRAIRTVWAGLATFLVAAPLDEIYHRIYGLDLTAWSPTHALLYIGTFLMIAGTLAGFLKSPEAIARPRQAFWFSLIFCLFLMEDVLFPLGQQEYGAVALWLINHGRSIADADLLARVKDPFSQTYGGFPLALYPVYLVGAYAFCMGLARRFIDHRWAATLATGLYLLFRAVAWTTFHFRGMPVPFVPYFTLGMAVTVDLTARYAAVRWRTVAGALAVTLVAYASAAVWPHLAIMPIWPASSIWMAALAGFAGLGLAGLLTDRLLGPQVQGASGTGPRWREKKSTVRTQASWAARG